LSVKAGRTPSVACGVSSSAAVARRLAAALRGDGFFSTGSLLSFPIACILYHEKIGKIGHGCIFFEKIQKM
jgi:hypothetical protein